MVEKNWSSRSISAPRPWCPCSTEAGGGTAAAGSAAADVPAVPDVLAAGGGGGGAIADGVPSSLRRSSSEPCSCASTVFIWKVCAAVAGEWSRLCDQALRITSWSRQRCMLRTTSASCSIANGDSWPLASGFMSSKSMPDSGIANFSKVALSAAKRLKSMRSLIFLRFAGMGWLYSFHMISYHLLHSMLASVRLGWHDGMCLMKMSTYATSERDHAVLVDLLLHVVRGRLRVKVLVAAEACSSVECTMWCMERSVSADRLVDGSTFSPLSPSGPQLVHIRYDS